MQIFTCLNCSQTFIRRQRQKFCSHKCFVLNHIKTSNIITICPCCKKEFLAKKSKPHKSCSHACANKLYRTGIPSPRKGTGKTKHFTCKGCGIDFIGKDLNYKDGRVRKWCNRKCYLTFLPELSRIRGKQNIKYFSKEEKRLASLKCGRESYRRHIDTRLIYYRQLAHKRRGSVGKYTEEEWNKVKESQNHTCLHCKKKEPEIKLTADHIIPISRWLGWSNLHKPSYSCGDIINIQALCKSCNSRKFNHLLDKINMI
jgi:5-methylcytosine-specific restriction endonuclease McrA